MSQETPKQGNSNKWMAILVVVIALIIVGWWIIKWLQWIVYGMIFLLILIPMIMNRKLVSKVFNYLKGLYKKHTALGILGTVGGIVGFLPFAAFLLVKTIWEFFKPEGEKIKKMNFEKNQLTDSELSLDNKISGTGGYVIDNETKFPPTEQ